MFVDEEGGLLANYVTTEVGNFVCNIFYYYFSFGLFAWELKYVDQGMKAFMITFKCQLIFLKLFLIS